MKISIRIIGSLVLALGLVHGCTKNETGKFPETPPAEVVERFYGLLVEGGKIRTREAFMMVSAKYRTISQGDFRRWTESFSLKENEGAIYKVVKTDLPTMSDKDGNWVASVRMEVRTPSSFGDYFTTTSKVNLILDKDSNKWKIDFMADSIDESDFMKVPAEARADETEPAGAGAGKTKEKTE